MKVISLHVDDRNYAELKALAASRGLPVAAVIREALARAVAESARATSAFDLPRLDAGRQLADWSRNELYDEIRTR